MSIASDFMAILNGFLVKTIYKIIKPNVKIGKGFRVYSLPIIKGPGKITIGDKVCAIENYGKSAYLLTYTKNSSITVGDSSVLSGVTISAANKVTIGTNALLGNSLITDSNLNLPIADFNDSTLNEVYVDSVTIGRDFWVGTNSILGSGTYLGDECVVASGAVIPGGSFGDRSLIAGNLARKIGETRVV